MEDNKDLMTAIERLPSTEEQDKNRRKRKTARAALSFGIMALLLAILFLAAVNIGSLKVSFPQLFRGIFLEPDETVSTIFDLRFPRIMISMLAGAAVAVSGVLFQAVLKNPLADPGIIGISSGAGFAAVIITAAAPALFFFTPFFAFLGGVLAFFLVYTLSWKGGLSPLRIILVGVAVNSMFTGLSSAMNSMSGGNMSGVASIVNGNITMKTWEDVGTLVPYVVIGLVLALAFAGKCNLLSLEDKTVRSLGVNVNTMRILISLAAVLLAGISTAVAGGGKLSGPNRSPHRKNPGRQRPQGADSFFYGKNKVLRDVSFKIKGGDITTIMGANGCGKSTLFSLMTKNLYPRKGNIFLSGKNIQNLGLKDFARKVSIVHQYNTSSDDITVERLVSFGRTPHMKMMQAKSQEDEERIRWAMEVTNIEKYRNREVARLSGGQRQRVWIVMALAQDTRILFLDEPTTYLDIRYQIEILELIRRLNEEFGITIIMVLHDINQAIHFSRQVIGLKDGTVSFQGDPQAVIDADSIRDLYGIRLDVTEIEGKKFVLTV